MSSGKASGVSIIAVLTLVIAVVTMVANWLSVPGFPYSPFRSRPRTEENRSKATEAGTITPASSQSASSSTSIRQRAKSNIPKPSVARRNAMTQIH